MQNGSLLEAVSVTDVKLSSQIDKRRRVVAYRLPRVLESIRKTIKRITLIIYIISRR